MSPTARQDPLVILAGGLGTRLREAVPDLPKVMAPVAGRPFLAWLLEALVAQGAQRCLLSLGYKAEAVLDWLDGGGAPEGLAVETVVEPAPLGTGGALRHVCETQGLAGRLIALNGDSYLDGGLAELRACPHDAVLAAVEVPDTARYGRLETDAEGRILAFAEKGIGGPGQINAGLYRLPVKDLAAGPAGAFSVERDVLPQLAAAGRLWTLPLDARFIDIGIPSDYERFQELAADLAARRASRSP